jgi:DNA mismatch repair protein MutS2
MKVGDKVLVKGYTEIGEILTIKGENAEVAMGLLKMKVKVANLTITEDEWEPEEPSHYTVDTKEKMQNFKFELDIRGKMKDEVITLLTTWADDAILIGVDKAKIIHGRGNGVLRDTVRSFLRKYNEIEKVGNEEGSWGDGATIVYFRN